MNHHDDDDEWLEIQSKMPAVKRIKKIILSDDYDDQMDDLLGKALSGELDSPPDDMLEHMSDEEIIRIVASLLGSYGFFDLHSAVGRDIAKDERKKNAA